ncbi:MAG: PEP-CTERM sorting domain-containing protein [Planctomycetes bacterium]|nr:PEP-CTERM sorting domain-containing protein [Planctomycetota bacterium]
MRRLADVLAGDYGLTLTGWTLEEAWGVSADGLVFAGWGTNPSGQTEAWIARVEAIPEPAGLVLLLGGLAALARRRRNPA